MINKYELICPSCNGSGKWKMETNLCLSSTSFIYTNHPCKRCDGVGRIREIVETTTREEKIEKEN